MRVGYTWAFGICVGGTFRRQCNCSHRHRSCCPLRLIRCYVGDLRQTVGETWVARAERVIRMGDSEGREFSDNEFLGKLLGVYPAKSMPVTQARTEGVGSAIPVKLSIVTRACS